MSDNTAIKFKRTSDYKVAELETLNETLKFGEPILINTTDSSGTEQYLVLGPNDNEVPISQGIFFRGLDKDTADRMVVYNSDTMAVENLSGQLVSTKLVTADKINTQDVLEQSSTIGSTEKFFLLGFDPDSRNIGRVAYFDLTEQGSDPANPVGIYIDNKGVMHGAAWNDYAEGRFCPQSEFSSQLAGRVVCETGKGEVLLSTEKLQPCSYVVSDTYGVTIGSGNINVTVAGKALVYVEDEVSLGDCVTAGPNGKAIKMSRQEVVNYPDRILGVVIEVPDYELFKGTEVNGRVWVEIK